MLRRGQPTLEVEREAFEKNQTVSIQKAINQIECAAKEKHVRNTILGSYQEKGAQTFWHVVRRLPLSSQGIIAWKFCHVLHKLLRDGHPNVLKDSIKYRQQLKDLGKNWGGGRTPFGYGRLIGFYLIALNKRMEFHMKYEDFPGNLSISDEDLENIGKNDVNAFFELSVDILDCIDTLMDLQESIFTSLDMSRAVSLTGPGQCRLSPCILVILDSSQLYDYAVKLLFKLHACLPADTLSGHRTRFKSCHQKLKKFYYICSNLQYFKRLIQVPTMPDSMPDFLLKSDGSHELGPVRVIPEDYVEPDRSPSPEPAAAVGELVNFDEIFGDSTETFAFNGNPEPPAPDHRDQEILQLRAEIERLKAEIDLMQTEHSQEVRKLLEKIRDLEQDLRESRMIARDASDDIERLRRQASDAEQQAESAVKAQSLLHGVEKRAIGNEELYRKLKEKHMGLVKDHAELLRKNADTKRQAETIQQSSSRAESESLNLKDELSALKSELESLKLTLEEKERLKKEERLRLLALAADEACNLVACAKESLDNDNNDRTCNAETLMKIVGMAKDSLGSLTENADDFYSTGEIEGLIRSLSSFGHWMAEAIINGGATCNMVQDDQGKALETACRNCGTETLKLLSDLKDGSSNVNPTETRENLNKMFEMARDLLPKIGDGEDLHDLVEQEMAATSHAVEQAAQRIEALLNEARERDSGVNLEVNERILDSCTELMQMIRILIASSKELQREIVDDGRGASSSKEFYMKNSRWTEGLISAAKAVGWGATMLTDAADLVVQGDGKFEELMVCSHEISASTAQLVAASRVKAGKQSKKLSTLQKASKNVNGATAKVLASTNAGRRQLDDNNDNLKDLQSTVTLTQIKMKEMDSQVKVLELEQALTQERLRLGALRKKHYELAGVKENEEEDIENEAPHPQEVQLNGNNNNNQSVGKKPNVSQKPHILPKPMTS